MLAPTTTPTPNPSPQGGGERTEFAARVSRHSWRDALCAERRRVSHRFDDLHIASAAADVGAECLANVVITRPWIPPQQSNRRHDEAGRAVAALRSELFVEPALHRRKPSVVAKR